MEPIYLIWGVFIFFVGYMIGGVTTMYKYYKQHWKE